MKGNKDLGSYGSPSPRAASGREDAPPERGRSEGQCPHLEFSFHIAVARMEDTNIKYAEVTGKCLNCGGIARFRGMPLGCTPAHPTMALDGSDANLPFTVGDEEYDGKAVGIVGRQIL